jgi:hypothetical protein
MHYTFVVPYNLFRRIKASSDIWLVYIPLYSSASVPTLPSVYIPLYSSASVPTLTSVYIPLYSSASVPTLTSVYLVEYCFLVVFTRKTKT